jgi:hypothetical protein
MASGEEILKKTRCVQETHMPPTQQPMEIQADRWMDRKSDTYMSPLRGHNYIHR